MTLYRCQFQKKLYILLSSTNDEFNRDETMETHLRCLYNKYVHINIIYTRSRARVCICVCMCIHVILKKKKSDALLQLPGGGQLQCLDLFPQRQQHYWRYTAIISLCHTPGYTTW